MEEIVLDKRILEKLTREEKSLTFYRVLNKAKTLNKHNLKTPNNVH
jgi:hypothetical protein